MAKAFTPKGIEAIKPNPAKRLEIPDPALSGLYLVVQQSGVKSWALRYRWLKKPKKLTLGRWPIMGLAEARSAASQAIEAVEHGSDPSTLKKKAKASLIEAELSERDKVKTLLDQYASRHLTTLKSGEEVKRRLELGFKSSFGDHNIHEITKRDIREVLDDIYDRGTHTSANRMHSYLSGFFNWCVERDAITGSPVQGIKKPAKENSREHFLSDDEIRWFWLACDEVGFPWGPIGKTLLLTGQRRGEVAGIRDTEIKGDIWYLAPERTKNGRAHTVPLTKTVFDVLGSFERVDSESGYLFTTLGDRPVSGFSKGQRRIAERMVDIANKERGEVVEIPHWTLHDLRRNVSTGMARLGIPIPVSEAAINHASGTTSGIVAVYQKYEYADEKRAALEKWGCFVADLVEGRTDNVVPMAVGR